MMAQPARMVAPALSGFRLDGQFPDLPPRDDMQNSIYLDSPAHQAALAFHFDAPDSTLVLSEIPLGWETGQTAGLLVPDLTIAFHIDRATAYRQRGYSIGQHGKPPDFVLEIASIHTARNDYTGKRDGYAAYGVPEYWRFDPTGGDYYPAVLAGERLVNGVYQPLELERTPGGWRGRGPALGLDVCWEDGQLRWYNPAAGEYLRTLAEEAGGRIAAEDQRDAALADIAIIQADIDAIQAERDADRLVSEARRIALEADLDAERDARIDMEAARDAAREALEGRIRQLEEELRRRDAGEEPPPGPEV